MILVAVGAHRRKLERDYLLDVPDGEVSLELVPFGPELAVNEVEAILRFLERVGTEHQT